MFFFSDPIHVFLAAGERHSWANVPLLFFIRMQTVVFKLPPRFLWNIGTNFFVFAAKYFYKIYKTKIKWKNGETQRPWCRLIKDEVCTLLSIFEAQTFYWRKEHVHMQPIENLL